ncbi:MAG: glycoside hydrolase family 5 protein [Methyloceanibacter sp.]|uniref:glycoside hydrolase family 5 protein n=1 Tax=Methyloceanibacter sp. TaxID=1965321 RepID=UPI003D6D76C2
MSFINTIASLDRRKLAWWLIIPLVLLGLIATLTTGASTNVCASEQPLKLERGVSIHAWLNWAPLTEAGDYRWPPYHDLGEWGSAGDFERIKAMGFDFVRLSVDPGPLLSSDGKRRDEAVTRLEESVRAVSKVGLKVVLDLHPVGQVKAWSAESIEGPADAPMSARYRSVVASVAKMLARVGTDKTALELMNEPQFYPCEGTGGEEWESVLIGLVRAVREAAPGLTLVVSGACGGNITGLTELDPARLDDDRLIYSFHFYEPHSFTHQGVGEARDVKGVPWPADDAATDLAMIFSKLVLSQYDLTAAEHSARLAKVRRHLAIYMEEGWSEAQIKSRFAEVRAWAKQNGIPTSRLLLGEFSALAPNAERSGGALDADRFRWLDAVRREADALGVGWAYWEYTDADSVAMEAIGMSQRAALPVGD